jgi:ABC-type polysaccharide/polyol phosphate export permease
LPDAGRASGSVDHTEDVTYEPATQPLGTSVNGETVERNLGMMIDQRILLRERHNEALYDLRDGLISAWPLWFIIGWLDIRQRYRRSTIGPLWITLSVAIFVTGLGLVYSTLFHMSIKDYLPYLATGIIIWTLLSSLMVEGCTTFILAEGAIKQNPVPISVHVYRVVWRNLIIFAHNIVIYVALVILFPVKVNAALILAPVGLLIVSVCGIGLALTLGIVSTRFRDTPIILTNIIQLIFFTTPIFWRLDTLDASRQWVGILNPFYHLVQIVRQPLLGELPSLVSWTISLVFSLATLSVGVFMYCRFRARIAYWL